MNPPDTLPANFFDQQTPPDTLPANFFDQQPSQQPQQPRQAQPQQIPADPKAAARLRADQGADAVKAVADALARGQLPPITGNPLVPGIPAAPLPDALKSDAQRQAEMPWEVNPKTGERFQPAAPGQSWLDFPMNAATHAKEAVEASALPAEQVAAQVGQGALPATAAANITDEARKSAARATSKSIEAAMDAATPGLVAGAVAAPLATGAALLAGMTAQKATHEALLKHGVDPEYAELAANIAGLVAGGVAGKAGHMAESRIAARGAETAIPPAAGQDAAPEAPSRTASPAEPGPTPPEKAPAERSSEATVPAAPPPERAPEQPAPPSTESTEKAEPAPVPREKRPLGPGDLIIPRQDGLGEPEREVERAVTERVQAAPQKFVDEYLARFPNHFSSDNAAKLFPEYEASPETRGQFRRAVGSAAAAISDEAFRQKVENSPPQDVHFVAGGSGAGKSTIADEKNGEGYLVYDGSFSNPDRAQTLVDHTLQNGHRAVVDYVHRDPVDSFRATLQRAQTEGGEQGRVVPADVHAQLHRGAADTIQRLAARYENNPDVAFDYRATSSRSEMRPGTLDEVRGTDYSGLEERLHNVLEHERANGRVPDEIYRRAVSSSRGAARAAQPEGEGVGRPNDGGAEPPVFPGERGEPGAGNPEGSPRSVGDAEDLPPRAEGDAAPEGRDERAAGEDADVSKFEEPKREPDPGVTLGSGFGALEPLFREAKEEGDALRQRRNAALAAAKAAALKPEQLQAGEKVRAYFTSERDLWAARSNQAIGLIKRTMLPRIQDREALGIAREFRHNRAELRAFIDGTHPFLQEVDGGAGQADKNLQRLLPVMKEAERILTKPTNRERAADAALTAIAERDLQEGRKGGWLGSRWQSDEYVPHALNPKGDGEVAKPPSTEPRQMGKVGKWFGFGERRSDRYPTLVHAVADGVIPKTLDPAALFTVHADQFARARATHLLEQHLADHGMGVWGDRGSAPQGWVQLAPHSDEFKQRIAYEEPNSLNPETGQSVLKVGTSGLYVPEFIAKALEPITDADWTNRIWGFSKLRTAQRGLKEAILGLSGFHLLTENWMAANDIGPFGMGKAFGHSLDAPETLANERDLIASGGTTAIQGSTMDAYRGLQPGTIPTRAEVIRGYIPGTKQALQLADNITRFTFDNVQRRFKIWSFALHRDAWMRDNPDATPEELAEAKKGIASFVNGVYGGLHWENMAWPRAMVEVARALALAPDWSGSNLALAKYASDAPVSASEFRAFGSTMAGATTKKAAQARLSRAFWTKQIVFGLAANQMLSLMFSRKLSPRPFQVYLGPDGSGKDVYQNIVFRGAAGDAVNLGTKIEQQAGKRLSKVESEQASAYGMATQALAGVLVGAGLFVEGKMAPITKLGVHVMTGRDDFGRDITPGELASDVLPVPITAKTAYKAATDDGEDGYLWSERILSLFGPQAQHVTPK